MIVDNVWLLLMIVVISKKNNKNLDLIINWSLEKKKFCEYVPIVTWKTIII